MDIENIYRQSGWTSGASTLNLCGERVEARFVGKKPAAPSGMPIAVNKFHLKHVENSSGVLHRILSRTRSSGGVLHEWDLVQSVTRAVAHLVDQGNAFSASQPLTT